ncbi:MAG: T9SS type A sorting domain-containing protein [Saprospiraceae bacterium]|nr:T9SS type A sorting domain-containing protein [Saprospiraceae bacterium]
MKKLTTQKKKTIAKLRNILLFILVLTATTSQSQNLIFSYSPSTIYVGDTITFTNSSTGFPAGTVFKWSFGDCKFKTPYPDSACVDTLYTQGGNSITYEFIYPGTHMINFYGYDNSDNLILDTTVLLSAWNKWDSLKCNAPPNEYCEKVCNGSFEDLKAIPLYTGEIRKAYSWSELASSNFSPWIMQNVFPSSDLFSTASTMISASVPNNMFGTQQPHSGNNYSGIILYKPMNIDSIDYREYLIARLASPLIAGVTYEVQMYVNLADNSVYAVEDIGIYIDKFYIDTLGASNPFTYNDLKLEKNSLPITPHVLNNTSNTISDTSAWTLITGTYTASGGEDGIYIGNFTKWDQLHVDTVRSHPICKFAYYYIDDVSIKPSIQDTIEKVICLNESIILEAPICDTTNYYNYIWTSNPNDTSLTGQQTNAVITVTPLMNTTYTLSFTDTNNVTDTVIAIVYVNSPPYNLPIISGKKFICGNPGISVYTILNFNPNTVYKWDINNSNFSTYPNILTDSTFTVNWANYPNGGIIYVYACEMGTFNVFKCCDPFTPADSAIYYCNDTISIQTTFSNEKISICGFLYINADVTINNSLIKFGQLSGIKILPGYTLTINNDSLIAGCNYMWDGIYADDSTTSIIITNNSFFGHATNAVVGAKNANISITSSEFKDNFVGVKIRNYNPECELVVWPDPTPPPPPANNTYIAGCMFHRSTTPMPTSLDPYYYNFIGVQIDSVYDITIGDYSFASLKNTFDNLLFGIKSINSGLQVYNNEFKNISHTAAVPIVDTYNHPLEGAIHCTKAIYTAGSSIPSSQYISCIKNDVIVGGLGLKRNVFENSNFGIFTYKHSLLALNNEFTEQYFNAIYDYLSLGISHINNNVIEQHNGSWANSAILNSAIRMESAFKSLMGKDLEILNNEIHNTRTGIAVINATSGTSAYTYPKYARIGSNLIYFDSFDPSINRKHYGITIQDCDRIRVAGNHIENNSGYEPQYGSYDYLQGIHVAHSTAAWIYDNHRIAKTGYGIFAVGVCTNTQFSCNDLDTCGHGFYFEPQDTIPNGGIVATFITQQGHASRASDNIWNNNYSDRIAGNLNIGTMPKVPWYFRGNHDIQPYSPYITNTNAAIFIQDNSNTNVSSQCVGLPQAIDDDDPDANIRNQRYGAIVREEITYDVLEDEFEEMNEEYLFEILYSDPDLMYLGEDDDTAYINFYNYRVNSTIAEFTEIQDLIDEGDINQALMENGIVVAQTVIEVNKQVTNDIYLNALANDIEFDQTQYDALFAIASLTPYVGGEGVYSARVMLGLDPDDLNLPYRKKNPYPDTERSRSVYELKIFPNPTQNEITIDLNNEGLTCKAKLFLYSSVGNKVLEKEIDTEQNIHTIQLKNLRPGVYFYNFVANKTYKGKIIIMD